MAALFHEAAARTLIALVYSAAFGLTGLVHLAGPRFLNRVYREAEYSPRFYRSLGIWMLLAAALLAFPGARPGGAIAGGFLIFATTVLMVERGRYLALVPGVPLLVALLPVLLAGVGGA